MKAYLSILFILLFSVTSKAQNFFVYIQSETKQPFYVKLDEKVMNSSATGYIVVPKLRTGNYTLNIGFPNDQWAVQNIPLIVGNSDAGFLLKNFGDKGWGLYNLQTMELSMNGASGKQSIAKSGDDVFASVLSGAANTKVVTTTTPTEVTITEIRKDTVPAPVLTKVQKLSSIDSPEGMFAVYMDGTNDTVRVFIPGTPATTEPTAVTKPEPTVKTEIKTETKTEPVKEQKFLDIELQNPNATAVGDTVLKSAAVETKPVTVKAADKPVVTFNSDCKSNAGEEDFLKIRKKMAREANEDAMVETSRRFLKAKCYTTEQIKNLSLLFLTDEGKYKFFDAAYPHVSDTQNFSSLISELKDAYYINRFKAMVRN